MGTSRDVAHPSRRALRALLRVRWFVIDDLSLAPEQYHHLGEGGVSDVGEVDTFDSAGNPVNTWKLDNGIMANSLPIGFSVWSMTVSPLDPTHIFATGGSTNSPACYVPSPAS